MTTILLCIIWWRKVVNGGNKWRMGMYRGLYEIKLDQKGRIIFPINLREQITQKKESSIVVITIDPDERCLLLYNLEIWQEIEKKVENLPMFNKFARKVQRLLIGHATDLEINVTGRILIPTLLRKYAQLIEKESIMLVGQGKKIEIWAKNIWTTNCSDWITEGLYKNLDNASIPRELEEISF